MVAVLTAVTSSAVWLSAQAMTIRTEGDLLRVRVPGFAFIDGPALERLHDGRALQLDTQLVVRARAGGAAVTEARHAFIVSFDVWEERFAVTRAGTPPRSVSHLTRRDAETWCLENLAVPLLELERLGRDAPFWLRLEYRLVNREPADASSGASSFALGRLIDALSRRRQSDPAVKSVEAGPFRLPN